MTGSAGRAVLEVVDAGATTTLQDGGRVGAARYGVPRSGPVDVLSHRLAARLVGVPPEAGGAVTALEVGPSGCRLALHGQATGLALAGDGAHLLVDGDLLPAPCVVVLAPGERCEVRARTWGYVVPAGRLSVPPVLGSRSRHPRSGLGPSLDTGTRLHIEDVVPVTEGLRPTPAVPGGPFQLLPAPQTHRFDRASVDLLADAVWTTTTAVDRMGARLDGPRLVASGGHDIVSDGIVAGALQVPGDGRPYVLTADHQTTGGYPKIGVLSAVDLARFVRVPPGHPVRFVWSDVATARDRLRSALAAIEDVVTAAPRPHGRVLGRANLIGGVTGPDADTP